MRKTWLMALAPLLWSFSAWAGPSLPKGLQSEVPDATRTATATWERDRDALEPRIAEADGQFEAAQGDDKTLKLEVKAAKARVDAEKATLKAAKKSKDKDAIRTAKDSVKAAKDAVGAADDKVDLNGALIDLLRARVHLLEAEHEWLDTQVQRAWAESIADGHPELDVARYQQAETKAEIAYEKARADLGIAEAGYAAKGGTIRGEAAAAAPAPAPLPSTEDLTPPPPPPEVPTAPAPAPE